MASLRPASCSHKRAGGLGCSVLPSAHGGTSLGLPMRGRGRRGLMGLGPLALYPHRTSHLKVLNDTGTQVTERGLIRKIATRSSWYSGVQTSAFGWNPDVGLGTA